MKIILLSVLLVVCTACGEEPDLHRSQQDREREALASSQGKILGYNTSTGSVLEYDLACIDGVEYIRAQGILTPHIRMVSGKNMYNSVYFTHC